MTIIMNKDLTRKSWHQRYRESEVRNIELVKYVEVLEGICKQILVYAAKQHDDMSMIVVPGTEGAIEVLEQICICVAPVCGDVEDMQIPPAMLAKMVEAGAMVLKVEPENDQTEGLA